MKFNVKILAISLILLCCLMGAASAAEDISADALNAAADDAVAADTVSEDITDSAIVEETPVEAVDDVTTEPAVPDDTTTEEINKEIQTDEISEESATVDFEPTRTTTKHVSTWANLEKYCEKDNDNYIIYLDDVITYSSGDIVFANSATIIGTPSNYITGGDSTKTLFRSTGNLNITFKNVYFKNMDAFVLMQLATSGQNKFINCSFDNIHTYSSRSSVIWNNGGWMTITGCNFTNCYDSFGVITNHLTYNTVFMNVEDCRFENNYGSYEPGAINNCGIMNVTNCIFNNNSAAQWAGAIHTHSKANTRIVNSNFTNNVAGTNGGAIFSYSNLQVINCNFEGNTANNNGGAICGYSYGSTYNITVENSRFTNNKVNSGAGGAIRGMNFGNLTVFYSNFTNNSASNGQAISGITETIDYCNCWNCTCPNCPNCTNCTHYVSNESANLKLYNNIYLNHTATNTDTVTISGNDYIFDYNVFINSTQNTHYNGTGNKYDLTDYPNPIFGLTLAKSFLGSHVIGDSDAPKEIYVNNSKDEDDGGDGSSWDEAYGNDCFWDAIHDISNNGYIYLAPSEENYWDNINADKNITIIGFDRKNTIITASMIKAYYPALGEHYKKIFINLTFFFPRGDDLAIVDDVEFINCTFMNHIITTADVYTDYCSNPIITENIVNSYVINFTDCEFKDFDIEGSLLEAYRFSQINFKNCKFENINANSIVNNTGGWTLQDAINFYDCTFTNVNVKGIVDVPTGTEPIVRYVIEGCSGVENFGPITESDRDFVNATGSKTETVMVAEIDADGNLFINLTDASGNAMAEEEVLISINGAEAVPYALGTDGTMSIALADLTDATGKLDIAVTYEENDDYKGSTGSVSTVLVINNVTVEVPVEVPVYITVNQTATSITASDLTATAKVAKTLTVTLKDSAGKVLANKTVKVTVNGKTSTVTTDKNGVAKVNVNYAKAGTYYYTLSFLGDNDYKASMKAVKVTVNKQATKATFAKKTFKVKATKKLTFTLKDAKGKAIKGKKITFTVNKKTYTAKTNAKGIATVKVKLTKKGKYTAVAKFAGDTTYKAISKKAAITVK